MQKIGLQIRVVARAAKLVGGGAALAKILKIQRQAIYQWARVPADHVIAIERATAGKVTRQELRPDLYPQERREAAA
jgi:DNA-binding transcriptional regulator YdaS (Cro superfamily)